VCCPSMCDRETSFLWTASAITCTAAGRERICFSHGKHPRLADTYGDQYYVKRLRVRRATRWKSRITGCIAMRPDHGRRGFREECPRQGDYVVIATLAILRRAKTMTVPSDRSSPLGDNSANSAVDAIGATSEKDVIGRPLFNSIIHFRRWGPCVEAVSRRGLRLVGRAKMNDRNRPWRPSAARGCFTHNSYYV